MGERERRETSHVRREEERRKGREREEWRVERALGGGKGMRGRQFTPKPEENSSGKFPTFHRQHTKDHGTERLKCVFFLNFAFENRGRGEGGRG